MIHRETEIFSRLSSYTHGKQSIAYFEKFMCLQVSSEDREEFMDKHTEKLTIEELQDLKLEV